MSVCASTEDYPALFSLSSYKGPLGIHARNTFPRHKKRSIHFALTFWHITSKPCTGQQHQAKLGWAHGSLLNSCWFAYPSVRRNNLRDIHSIMLQSLENLAHQHQVQLLPTCLVSNALSQAKPGSSPLIAVCRSTVRLRSNLQRHFHHHDGIPFPWFANLFARRYVPYSRMTDKPIARDTVRGPCQARMKNYLARTRDSHPRTSVRSLWVRQPCIGAPRKDSREAVWRSVQPGLAWPGLASMVPCKERLTACAENSSPRGLVQAKITWGKQI